ncbi:MAG TPA: prolipoprotein diacylglyceryl transferase family protein [Polyangia bacterium]|nr:prolipoprotein diacylglyceryl transferase family protein [Polyangia bacterium]
MIPYLEIPSLPIYGSLAIHPFGVLVAIGIFLGAYCVRLRAKQIGLDEVAAGSISTWVVLIGFVVAHLFDVVAYQPTEFGERWSAMFEGDTAHNIKEFLIFLLLPTRGISSFGGFLGALIGLLWWTHRYRQPIFPFADALLFGLAPGWTFGRLGCFSAHDHPGRHTDFFLAVRYPDGPRFDLGLYEAIFAGALTALFFILYRKPQKVGTYAALSCILYAPVRFGLDFLRVTDLAGADPRYFGLTPAQYGAIALFVTGLVLAWKAAHMGTEVTNPPEFMPSPGASSGPAAASEPAPRSRKRQKQSARG